MLLPIARLASAWLAGIALADALAPGIYLPATLAAVAAIGWLAGAARPAAALGAGDAGRWPGRGSAAAGWRGGLALVLVLALGALRREAAREDLGPGHVAAANGRGAVSLVGRVAEAPQRRERGWAYRLRLQAHPRAGPLAPTRGLLLVEAPSYPAHAYGDLLLVEGEPQAPPQLADFDYRAYLARQGVHSLVHRPRIERLEQGGGLAWRRALIALRERGARALAAALPEPEAALVTGILLGDDSGLPKDLKEAFRASNTSHVIAISGSNIALLTAFLGALLGRLLGRRRAILPILALVLAYSLLVGGDAAVLRAALMGGLSLLALRLGRAADAQAGLFASAWLLTAYDPQLLWDLGFQLSFAATAGLIRFAGPWQAACQAWLERRLPPLRARQGAELLAEMLLITLVAQVCTWPLIAHATGQVSLVGLLANALVLPAQPPLMALGALALAAQLLHPWAGSLAGALAWLPATWTLRVVDLLGHVPGASLSWRLPLWGLVAWYLALGLVGHGRLGGWLGAARGRLGGWLGAARGWLGGWSKAAGGRLGEWSKAIQERLGGGRRARAGGMGRPCGCLAESDGAVVGEGSGLSGRAGEGAGALSCAAGAAPAAAEASGAPAWLRRLVDRSVLPGGPVDLVDDRPPVRGPSWRLLAFLGAAAVLAWTAAAFRPDGLLHLYLLDVGQGDALLLVSPNGRRLLIDGGPSGPALLAQVGRLTAPWDRRLDLVLLTHPDADHVGGLPGVVDRYRVGTVLDPELEAESPDAAAWTAALAERPLPRQRASAGGRIVLDRAAGLSLDILWPPEPRLTGVASPTNENAVVLRLRYGATSALFTGDIGAPAEAALLARGVDLRAELLKVAHHGSKGSSTAEFLAAVRPQAALIGVGRDNRYGHPAPEALDRLTAAGVNHVWRTDRDGRVELVSDGQHWWRP